MTRQPCQSVTKQRNGDFSSLAQYQSQYKASKGEYNNTTLHGPRLILINSVPLLEIEILKFPDFFRIQITLNNSCKPRLMIAWESAMIGCTVHVPCRLRVVSQYLSPLGQASAQDNSLVHAWLLHLRGDSLARSLGQQPGSQGVVELKANARTPPKLNARPP